MSLNIITRFYSIIIAYANVLLITNYYSFDQYGEYVMFIVYSTILSTISTLGVGKTIISGKRFNFENNYSIKLIIVFIHAFIAISLASIVSLLSNFINIYMIIIVLVMTLNSIFKTYFLLHSFNKIYSLLSYAIEQTSFLILLILMINSSYDLDLIEIGLLSHSFLFFCAIFLIIKFKLLKVVYIKLRYNELYDFYKESLSFLTIDSIQIISQFIDKILIAKFLTNTDVGIYSALEKLSRLSISIFNSMSPLMMKKIVDCNNNKKLEKTYEYFSTVVIIISLPVTFSLIYFGKYVLSLFDSSLLGFFNIFILLLLARLIQYSTGFKAVVLQMRGLQKYDIYSNIIKLVLFSLLIPVFVYYYNYGLYGIVITLMISIIISSLIQVLSIKKKYQVKYIQKYFYFFFLLQFIIYFLSIKIGIICMLILQSCYVIFVYSIYKKYKI